MMDFEYYFKKGDVKKITQDIELAKSLRKNLLKRAEKILKLDLSYSIIIFENLYDCLRGMCDAILAIDGYKSYSHQASIVYLRKYNFNESFTLTLDNFRYKRNSSKYYGKDPSDDDTTEIKNFYLKNIKLLLKILDEKLK